MVRLSAIALTSSYACWIALPTFDMLGGMLVEGHAACFSSKDMLSSRRCNPLQKSRVFVRILRAVTCWNVYIRGITASRSASPARLPPISLFWVPSPAAGRFGERDNLSLTAKGFMTPPRFSCHSAQSQPWVSFEFGDFHCLRRKWCEAGCGTLELSWRHLLHRLAKLNFRAAPSNLLGFTVSDTSLLSIAVELKEDREVALLNYVPGPLQR